MSGYAAIMTHERGETIVYGLRSPDAPFDGTETVTASVKRAGYGYAVPPRETPAVLSLTPVFVPAAGEALAHWLFTITPAQSAALEPGDYVADALIEFASGVREIPSRIAIRIVEAVTP